MTAQYLEDYAVGQIYWYVLDSKRPVMDLKEIEDWDIEKYIRAVPGGQSAKASASSS